MRGFFTFSIAIFLATGSVSAVAGQTQYYECIEGEKKSSSRDKEQQSFNACITAAKKGEAQIHVVVVGRDSKTQKTIHINADYCEKNKSAESCKRYFNGDYAFYQDKMREIEKEKKGENLTYDKRCQEIYGDFAISDGTGGCKASRDNGFAKTHFDAAVTAKKEACEKRGDFNKQFLYDFDKNTGACTENHEAKNAKNRNQENKSKCKYPYEWTGADNMQGKCKMKQEIADKKSACEKDTKTQRWDDKKFECVALSQGEKHKLQAETDKTEREKQKENLEGLLNDKAAFEARQKAYQKREKEIEALKRRIADRKRQEELAEKQSELQAKIGASNSELERLRYQTDKKVIDLKLGPITNRVNGYTTTLGDDQTNLTELQKLHDEDKKKYGEHAFDSADPEKARKSAERSVKEEAREIAQATEEIIDEAAEAGYSSDMRQAVMREEEYGGHFGGASKKKTQKTNEVINTSLRTTEQAATVAMQMQGQEQVNHVQNGTQTAAEAQGKLFEIAGSQFTLQSVAEYIGSGFQAWRSFKHGQSAGKVKARGEKETEEIAGEIIKAKTERDAAIKRDDPEMAAKIDAEIERLQGEIRDNVSGNQVREVEAQQTEAGTQALVALGTGVSATLKVRTASKLQDAAKNMQNPNYYGLNTGGSIVNDGLIDPALTSTPSSDALIDPAMLEDASHAGNTPLLDLNPDTTLRDPPTPAMNMAGMPQNPGGSGGGGAGSAGGTSRAQDESSGNQAQTRDPKAGTYAASEGGGKYASRGASSSNGPGVKVDSAFADLLKKFLPGSDDKKDKPMLDLNANRDRSPASNQAAVIGRNKNIFDEIHKRYQKKNAEGAVIF